MSFWGIEVKPGKPYPYHSDNVRGTLHITQATLGLGSSKERSTVQCSVGHKKPIFICALLPNKNESCPLDLEFDEDDLVAFSVIGPRSIHLSGYFVAYEGESVRDDYESDSFGEDIAETESDSSEYNTNDDYDNDEESEDGFFVRDDIDYGMFPPSNAPKSRVVIEEIMDDDKPNRDDQTIRQKKKLSNGSLEDTNSQHQIVVKRDASTPVIESEDEDGFPIFTTQKSESGQKLGVDAQQTDDKTTRKPKKRAKDSDSASNSERKAENVDEDGQPDCQKKKKKKNKKRHLEEQVKENADKKQPKENEVMKMDEPDHKLSNENSTDVEMDTTPVESQPEGKNKKRKNKKKTVQENGDATNLDKSVTPKEQQSRSTLQSEQQKTETKASKMRTFPNGLVVEEVAMGKPDGKRASPGKQVSVRYIGKLKNGKIFDSNVRGPPFKFRLGLGQVIAGWDVGVDGMRVGDKRRLTIPPSMGYGSKGAGGKIPPNSWLVFDVELIDVR